MLKNLALDILLEHTILIIHIFSDAWRKEFLDALNVDHTYTLFKQATRLSKNFDPNRSRYSSSLVMSNSSCMKSIYRRSSCISFSALYCGFSYRKSSRAFSGKASNMLQFLVRVDFSLVHPNINSGLIDR